MIKEYMNSFIRAFNASFPDSKVDCELRAIHLRRFDEKVKEIYHSKPRLIKPRLVWDNPKKKKPINYCLTDPP